MVIISQVVVHIELFNKLLVNYREEKYLRSKKAHKGTHIHVDID